MSKKACLWFFFSLLLVHSVFASGLHFVFDESAGNVIGVSPRMRSADDMFYFALEQAAVFAAQLDKSFCIFRHAAIDRSFDEGVQYDEATFIVNVVAEWDTLMDFLNNLECVESRDFHGYQLGIWVSNADFSSTRIYEFTDGIGESVPQIDVFGNVMTAKTVAQSAYLDIALDEAFRYALSEISRYQDLHIQNMSRRVDDFSELALLSNSENIVTDVKMTEVKIFYDNSTYIVPFTVEMTLKKEF